MGEGGRLYRSSIGAKLVMALTGVALFGFVIVHLLGNLQIFAGREAINAYGVKLRSFGPMLWIARLGLIAIAGLHVATALRIMRANDAARPVAYAMRANRQVKAQTRFMATSGLLLLGYALFHLAHFTWGFVNGASFRLTERLADGTTRHDVYSMMVIEFRVWWVSAAYLAAMVGLALHLCHGIPSFFQTLGLAHPRYDGAIRLAGPVVATLVFAGYAAIPVAALLGILEPPGGTP